MGNQIKSAKLLLPPDVYVDRLQSLAEQKENTNNNKKITIFSGSGDVHVLQIIIEYCQRREQVRIIEAVTSIHRNIILSNIKISPYADVYAIADFNKKNSVFDGIDKARELMFKLFFTNVVVKGKKKNIEYLLANNNDIMLTFMHYVAVRKGDILSSKTENETVEIDLFVEKFREHKSKEFSFNFDDVFSIDDDKSANIKYKSAYKFEKFNREIEADDINISWRLLNDTFLKYLITNQVNFCFDDVKDKNKGINEDINLKDLDILSGSSSINTSLSGYIINSTSTKHQRFKDGQSIRSGVKYAKVAMSTNKLSSSFLVPAALCKHDKDKNGDEMIECGIMVLTVRNPSSEDHIKEDAKFGVKKIYAACHKFDNLLGGRGPNIRY